MKGRWIAATAVLWSAASIALGSAHPFGDPREGAGAARDRALLGNAEIPEQAKMVLLTKCADCHSYATRWPVYANFAPGSWLIERDVMEGRKHMNLSTWGELTPELRAVLAGQIVGETRAGLMPPLQYRVLHWGARLSAADLQSLAMLSKQEGTADGGRGGMGDAQRGKALFERRCTGCHATDVNREGPHLRGVFGRRAGSLPDFSYSMALKQSGVTWNEDLLNQWLTDPDAMVPGNNMGFNVMKANERADLLAFLKQLK